MSGAGTRRYGLIAVVAGSVVLLDQLTKTWAVNRLADPGESIGVVGPLEFRLAFNSGMAFSKGQGRGVLIGLIAIGIVVGLLLFARTVQDRPSLVALGLVIGGALGNVVDRLFRAGPPLEPRSFMGGRVVDWIYVGWWPTFNVADASIVVGGILLALLTLRTPTPDVKAPTSPS